MTANTTSDIYASFIKAYALLQPAIFDSGLSGYTWSNQLSTTASLGNYNSDGDITRINSTFAPLYGFAAENPSKINFTVDFASIPSYFSIFSFGFNEGGGASILGSRLFPRSAFESEETAEALGNFLAEKNLSTTWHLGKPFIPRFGFGFSSLI